MGSGTKQICVRESPSKPSGLTCPHQRIVPSLKLHWHKTRWPANRTLRHPHSIEPDFCGLSFYIHLKHLGQLKRFALHHLQQSLCQAILLVTIWFFNEQPPALRAIQFLTKLFLVDCSFVFPSPRLICQPLHLFLLLRILGTKIQLPHQNHLLLEVPIERSKIENKSTIIGSVIKHRLTGSDPDDVLGNLGKSIYAFGQCIFGDGNEAT